MRNDGNNVFQELADPNAETKAAEQTCRHTRVKHFEAWMKIAYARDDIEEMALHIAEVDPEEGPGYKRSPAYQAAISRLEEYFPCLLEYRPAARKQLSWLNDHASELHRWHDKLPADNQAKLTSPSIIRKRYEVDKSTRGA
jgi:hypothetical protein